MSRLISAAQIAIESNEKKCLQRQNGKPLSFNYFGGNERDKAMESFYQQTTVACTILPAAFSTKFDSAETMFNLHYQIVLRVGDNANLIEEKWRLQFYKYLATCVKICGGRVEAIGGAPDQVHLLIALCSAKALAQFLRELKLLSQTWVRRKLQISDFAWQDGSDAFTVSLTQIERVKAFIYRRNAHYRQNGSPKEQA